MKPLTIALLAGLTLLSTTILAEGEEETRLKIQAWDFTDSSLQTNKGDPCAEFITYLMGPVEKYKMLGITSVQGPPGVVYTLQNYSGDIAILKCGLAGSCGGDEGGEH
jgi:hypothetical protein